MKHVTSEDADERIRMSGIIAIFRGTFEQKQLLAMAETLCKAGIMAMEVTLNSAGAEAHIRMLCDRMGTRVIVGAGTVRTAEQVEAAVAAGAQFLVSPGFDPAAVAQARLAHVLMLPGVLTPSEVQQAATYGCTMLKLFPSEMFGPAYLKALRAPFNDIDFVPTGGISIKNVAAWRAAGAVAVAAGSTLLTPGMSLGQLAQNAKLCAVNGTEPHMTTRDVPYDVTTIGETLLRISVGAGVALETADTAALHAGGAESNFACALAQLGRHVAWASRLPEQPLGRFIANALRQSGVDLALVEWCPAGRVGTYYVELRLPPTPVRVIYDRAGSCAAMMQPGDIPVERLLNSRLLHLTGITPALSGSCHQSMIRLADEARRRSVPFSFDINYRRKLWTPSAARDALLPLARGAEILFVAQSDAADVFGLSGSPDQTVASLRDLFQAKHVVLSIGEGGIVVWDGKKILRQSAQPTAVIDRLGAGDALAAGVIHGWLAGDFEAGLQYGLALAALSLRSQGDSVVVHPDELAEMVAGGSTRASR